MRDDVLPMFKVRVRLVWLVHLIRLLRRHGFFRCVVVPAEVPAAQSSIECRVAQEMPCSTRLSPGPVLSMKYDCDGMAPSMLVSGRCV